MLLIERCKTTFDVSEVCTNVQLYYDTKGVALSFYRCLFDATN